MLKQYDEALAKLPARLNTIQKQTQLSIETYNPEADLRSLIEGHRTGPFKPQAQVYESLEVDLPDVNFGIDLRRWAGDHGWKAATTMPRREKGAVPVVLEGLLNGIANLYEGLEDAGTSLRSSFGAVLEALQTSPATIRFLPDSRADHGRKTQVMDIRSPPSRNSRSTQ